MTVASIPHLLSSELVHHITTNQENLNLQTLFGSSKYSSGINKRVIIASGVTIGATSTANYALNIPSGFGGRLVLVNEGSILAAGGAANGGTGGNAINAGASNIFIDNRGYIYAGGGGGGRGGDGGNGGSGGRGGDGGGGYYTVSGTNNVYKGYSGYQYSSGPYYQLCQNACVQAFGSGSYCSVGCYLIPGQGGCGCPCWSIEARGQAECNCCYRNESYSYNVYTSGGTGGNGGSGGSAGSGGNGGVGQGYNNSTLGGSSGSSGSAGSTGDSGSAGGTNAGSGGQGGTGGTGGSGGNGGSGGSWGQDGSSGSSGNSGNGGATGNSGSNGNNGSGSAGSAGSSGSAGSGGSAGGLAGFYIVNNGNVTWLANGTRAGRIG